nr:MAG TPA: hypothetical protein [Caudoviricetes sp.]
MKTPYDSAEKAMKKVYSDNQKRFNNMRLRLAKFDELNVMQISKSVKSLFNDIRNQTMSVYMKLAKEKYPKATKKLLLSWLEMVYIVVEYQFENEFLRKQARYIEALTALSQNGKSLNGAEMLQLQRRMLNSLNLQLDEFSVYVVDKAMQQEMIETEVKKVKWNAEMDKRTCEECRSMDGQTYDVHKIPPKPHIHCRCWVEKV